MMPSAWRFLHSSFHLWKIQEKSRLTNLKDLLEPPSVLFYKRIFTLYILNIIIIGGLVLLFKLEELDPLLELWNKMEKLPVARLACLQKVFNACKNASSTFLWTFFWLLLISIFQRWRTLYFAFSGIHYSESSYFKMWLIFWSQHNTSS